MKDIIKLNNSSYILAVSLKDSNISYDELINSLSEAIDKNINFILSPFIKDKVKHRLYPINNDTLVAIANSKMIFSSIISNHNLLETICMEDGKYKNVNVFTGANLIDTDWRVHDYIPDSRTKIMTDENYKRRSATHYDNYDDFITSLRETIVKADMYIIIKK